jgi:transposase
MAPLPVRIIDKSLVSDRIIIDTIVGKYADHNPLYRQSVISHPTHGPLDTLPLTLKSARLPVSTVCLAVRIQLRKGSLFYCLSMATTKSRSLHANEYQSFS